ncbi:acyl-CoA desaturase [Nostoc sp. WHI]|uniref:acyl-CoA desaturase n=1 Tax=Nostoc sp. WHI TaxID=2650611 RepID=UPI0018C4CBF4|nr:fatty acid desaturase [Nostoc sp. WHI]MBG1271888.1 acyl-CoA desaturase [Nostoc sp. WHI]
MTIAVSNSPCPRWNVILFTVALHLAALLALIPSNFSWAAIGVAVFLHWITISLGISLGFHRLASHRSLQTSKFLEYFLILCGTLAGQGGVFGWVGYHRSHHLHTDKEGDPHNSNQGFWWSHINWLMHDVPMRSQLPSLTKDVANDRFYQFCHKYYIILQVGLAVLLYFLGGFPFVVWGIFVRLFVGFHGTFFVNSACHKFGYKTYDTGDRSTNCWWVALISYGEGWHNNHHAFQYSARHGLQWWEIDLTWTAIQILQAFRLVDKVRVPPKQC